MDELIRREAASLPREFTGERLTGAISGQVESEHYHRYLLAREFCRGLDVLDVASGEGYGSSLLAQVARSVVGVEIDAGMVALARREFIRADLRYEQGDARALPLADASIDVAVSFETLEHLSEHDQFLAELRRVLRPGGLLVISTPDREIYSAPGVPPNPHHVRELSRIEFETLIKRHFAEFKLAGQRSVIGSAIAAAERDVSQIWFERHSDKDIERSSSIPRAPYLFALASNGALPSLQNSVYIYRDDLDTDWQVRLQADAGRLAAEKASRDAVTQAAAAKVQAAEAVAQAAVAKARVRDVEARLIEAEARAAEVARRLRAIEVSSSWRATAPLRYALGYAPFLIRWFRRGASVMRRPIDVMPAVSQGNFPAPRAGVLAHGEIISLPTSEQPLVSVIICTYGKVRFTLACLQSIARHPPGVPIEVIVVDDAYPQSDEIAALGEVRGIHLVRNEANLGFLRSCNVAAGRARGRYLYMLNNDTELQDGAIDALVHVLEADSRAGMVGSKLVYPDGRLQEAGGVIWADASGWNFGRGDDPSLPQYCYLREVDYCSGASIMVRRTEWEALEGFDEAFAPAYYEDTDLAFRIRARGMKILYQPKSVVVHWEGISHGTDLSSGVKAHQVSNKARMLERWGAMLASEHYSSGKHVLRARERGRARKTILIADHYVPEPDRDAGSRSVMGIIDSLLDDGWIVKFWPQNGAYSSVYTTPLERRGVEVLDQRATYDLGTWLAANGGDLDHVLVSRPTVAVEVLPQLARRTTAVRSFYGVDLHFARLRLQAASEQNPVLLKEATAMEKLERSIWRQVDIVIYPSEAEAAVVRAMMPRADVRSIVPFCFESSPARANAPKALSILFVAGFAHAPNVDAAVFLVEEVLPRLKRVLTGVKVILAGSKPTERVQALAGPDVTVTGYITDADLDDLYGRQRVAIVPLRFGAGVKGKVVESLSRGLPLVTTTIGAQGIADLEGIIPVVDDIDGMVTALHRLLTDDDVWMAQSTAQLNFARRFFSREAMRSSVLSALEPDVRSMAKKRSLPSAVRASVMSMWKGPISS